MEAPSEQPPAAVASENYPGNRTDGKRWWSFWVNWWDNGVVFGPVVGNPGGNKSVWAVGNDFADAAANAIRLVESEGHSVAQITVQP